MKSAVLMATLAIASVLSAGAIGVREERGTRWVCGADGERIVGVGAFATRQKEWRCETSCTAGADRVEFEFRLSGGKDEIRGWMVDLPLGKDAVKEPKVHKIGRWRRFAANSEAVPMEHLLGKYRVIRSPHGNLLMELSGNENWSSERRDHVEFKAMDDGGRKGRLRFFPMREGEEAYECAARVSGVPFALRVATNRRNNLFDAGAATMEIALKSNAGHATNGVPLQIIVRDWDGREVFAKRGSASFGAYERKSANSPLDLPGRGIYFVEVALGGEFVRTTIAVIAPFEFRHRKESVMGLNFRCGRVFKDEKEEEYRLAARLGMAYIRSGDNRIARRYGMEAGYLTQMPKFDYVEGEERSEAELKGWMDTLAEYETEVFEFGNEIGHFADTATRHELYDRYSGWLNAIRAAREKRGMGFKVLYGTSAKRPDLVRLIDEKGIFARLDALVVHPGRLNWTSDLAGGGWRYYGLVHDSRVLYESIGQKAKPIYLTETYTKTRPNNCHSDSLRQSAENAVLNVVLAMAEGCRRLCVYQLHEGVSYDENGINLDDTEYHYGILQRDNSLKPSAIAYETAAEELDGAKFVRWIGKEGTKLKGCMFDTPRGMLAVIWDRTEGYDLRTQGTRARAKGEEFFHFEPWLDNWRTKVEYEFAGEGKEVTIRDVIGRTRTEKGGGAVKIGLTGSPVFVRGLKSESLPTAETSGNSDAPRTEAAENDNRLY